MAVPGHASHCARVSSPWGGAARARRVSRPGISGSPLATGPHADSRCWASGNKAQTGPRSLDRAWERSQTRAVPRARGSGVGSEALHPHCPRRRRTAGLGRRDQKGLHRDRAGCGTRPHSGGARPSLRHPQLAPLSLQVHPLPRGAQPHAPITTTSSGRTGILCHPRGGLDHGAQTPGSPRFHALHNPSSTHSRRCAQYAQTGRQAKPLGQGHRLARRQNLGPEQASQSLRFHYTDLFSTRHHDHLTRSECHIAKGPRRLLGTLRSRSAELMLTAANTRRIQPTTTFKTKNHLHRSWCRAQQSHVSSSWSLACCISNPASG